MIIVRSPLRISLGGGGTDLPSYYKHFGGFCISAAIDRYVYIAIHNTFAEELILKYSRIERVFDIDSIQHPIIREAIRLTNTDIRFLEITSMADIHAGTGLGSSGSFTTALLKALHLLKREHVTPYKLAEEACKIELDILGEPIGKQDQFIAAHGGIQAMRFTNYGDVFVEPVRMDENKREILEKNLLLFFTGQYHRAGTILADQDKRTKAMDADMLSNLHYIKLIGAKSLVALESGDLSDFAELMDEHWQWKQRRAGTTSERVNELYRLGKQNGALGGKLVGAGGGGFLMFYTGDPDKLRASMAEAGIPEVKFTFDYRGTTTVIQ